MPLPMPNETLVDTLAEGISDANDIDANYTTLATGAAQELLAMMQDRHEVNLPLLLEALEDYIDLQRDGNVDPAGRIPASDVQFHANRLRNLFEYGEG